MSLSDRRDDPRRRVRGAAPAERAEAPGRRSLTAPSVAGGGGSATVVGAAEDTEAAYDNGLAPEILAAWREQPDLGIDEVLEKVAASTIDLTGSALNGEGLQHPTMVQYGQAPSAPGPGETRRRAVLIANQQYTNARQLYSPKAEAGRMQGALATRGYEAEVHDDRPADAMGSLWDAMVGAAQPGDELVAFFSGHGIPEGLAGIEHALGKPGPRDVFTTAQVAGVVSAATDRGAHIRFIMDSCHSGAAVQAVREERTNELAAQAGVRGQGSRAAALAVIREVRTRLVDHYRQRKATIRRLGAVLDELDARKPPAEDAAATAAWSAERAKAKAALADAAAALDRDAAALWAAESPRLAALGREVGHAEAPPPVTDPYTLGAQLDYLDELWDTVAGPLERALAGAPAAESLPAPAAR